MYWMLEIGFSMKIFLLKFAWLKDFPNLSTVITNRLEERGHPCLTPLLDLKIFVGVGLIRTTKIGFEMQPFIHSIYL
jgi:hypothetical protein